MSNASKVSLQSCDYTIRLLSKKNSDSLGFTSKWPVSCSLFADDDDEDEAGSDAGEDGNGVAGGVGGAAVLSQARSAGLRGKT